MTTTIRSTTSKLVRKEVEMEGEHCYGCSPDDIIIINSDEHQTKKMKNGSTATAEGSQWSQYQQQWTYPYNSSSSQVSSPSLLCRVSPCKPALMATKQNF